MKINPKKLKDAGIEIIEETHCVTIEAPIKLESITISNNESFTINGYIVDLNKEEIYDDDCNVSFSLYEDGRLILESLSLEELQDYLRERFGQII